MESTVGINLRRHRVANKLNQTELAKKAGISRNAYRGIETGKSQPKPETMEQLCAVLGIGVFDLLQRVPELHSVRFRATKTMTAQERAIRDQVIADAGIWLENYNELEALLGVKHQPSSLFSIRKRNPEAAAKQARVLLEINDGAAVRQLCDILERERIKLHFFQAQTEKVFGFCIGSDQGGPAVAVNIRKDISVERWIFTTAHELGHLILHANSFADTVSEEPQDEEDEANRFASEFLMPANAFAALWQETNGLDLFSRVMKIKRHFLVSYKVVLMRMRDEGLVDRSIWPRFYSILKRKRDGRSTGKVEPLPQGREAYASFWKRSREFHPLDEYEFYDDHLDGLVRQAFEKELISLGRAAEMLTLSTAEMRERSADWKLLSKSQ